MEKKRTTTTRENVCTFDLRTTILTFLTRFRETTLNKLEEVRLSEETLSEKKCVKEEVAKYHVSLFSIFQNWELKELEEQVASRPPLLENVEKFESLEKLVEVLQEQNVKLTKHVEFLQLTPPKVWHFTSSNMNDWLFFSGYPCCGDSKIYTKWAFFRGKRASLYRPYQPTTKRWSSCSFSPSNWLFLQRCSKCYVEWCNPMVMSLKKIMFDNPPVNWSIRQYQEQ